MNTSLIRQSVSVALLLTLPVLTVCAAHPKIGTPTIPPGSTIYIDTNNGFDMFLMAALQSKHVSLRLVSTADKADYILDSAVFHSSQFVATKSFAMSGRTSEAAVKLTSKAGEIVWAYAVGKGMLRSGSQSIAESCAKHLRDLVAK